MSTKRRLMANCASGLLERSVNLPVQVWLYQYLISRQEYGLYRAVTWPSPPILCITCIWGRLGSCWEP